MTLHAARKDNLSPKSKYFNEYLADIPTNFTRFNILSSFRRTIWLPNWSLPEILALIYISHLSVQAMVLCGSITAIKRLEPHKCERGINKKTVTVSISVNYCESAQECNTFASITFLLFDGSCAACTAADATAAAAAVQVRRGDAGETR